MSREKPIILAGEFWERLIDLVVSDDPDSGRYVKAGRWGRMGLKLLVERFFYRSKVR